MAIDKVNIESFYDQPDFQPADQWVFQFLDQEYQISKKIVSTNIPFPQLSHEMGSSGLKRYTGVEHVNEITLTLYEDIKFDTLKYFQEWLDYIYDFKNNVFRVAKTRSEESKMIRDARAYYFFGNENNPLDLFNQHSDLSRGNGEPLQYTVNLFVDRIEIVDNQNL